MNQKYQRQKVEFYPYISANEINFLAFNLATEEYHSELYEALKSHHGSDKDYKSFDNCFFVIEKRESKDSPWRSEPNEVSKHTFIRNQIHHREENGKASYGDLESSIKSMRSFLPPREENQISYFTISY